MKVSPFLISINILIIHSNAAGSIKIGGNKTLSECFSGGMTADSDMTMSTTAVIKKYGYPVEEHAVVTDDGYIITVHRIPGKIGATPVYLSHGLMSTSMDWVFAGKDKALGLMLFDGGYDVWMGNARGNIYSRCHINYTASDSKFWDFSWHAVGAYDMPAVITYINDHNSKNIFFVGHSVGATEFYVMASERSDMLPKVKMVFSLAPVCYIDYAKSYFLYLRPLAPIVELYLNIFGEASIPTQNSITRYIEKYLCTIFTWQMNLCIIPVFLLGGFDYKQMNYTSLSFMFYHYPAGDSWRSFLHYDQIKSSGKFQQYDYGPRKNIEVYKNVKPPEYNLSKVNVPVGILWSENDYFTDQRDLDKLRKQLPNITLDYKIKWPKFNHLDFISAKEANKYVYYKVLSTMKTYD